VQSQKELIGVDFKLDVTTYKAIHTRVKSYLATIVQCQMWSIKSDRSLEQQR